jgi:peptidyl-tRNA hydrolase, PTH1 family
MKFLICGLGNIGAEYEHTRHNIGFMVLDRLAEKGGVNFTVSRLAYHAEMKTKGRTLVLVKPTTFMNLSGKAYSYWLKTAGLEAEQSIVITDDLALPFGKLRIKAKGSHGGHNGLRNIQEVMNSEVYPRMRMGIGDEFAKGHQVDYVLGEFSKENRKDLDAYIDRAVDAVLSFASIGLERTMNTYNTK